MRYVKVINKHAVFEAPTHAVLDGKPVGNIRDKPEVLAALGYLPLTEAEAPEGENWQPVYTVEDGKVVQKWTEVPVVIQLDRTKLIAKLASLGLDGLLNQWTQQDLSIATWWFSEMCYIKGSSMADKIKTALNLTQEDLDAIADECQA